MEGSSAQEDLDQPHHTQVRLAVSDEVSDEYFNPIEKRHPLSDTRHTSIRDLTLDFYLVSQV